MAAKKLTTENLKEMIREFLMENQIQPQTGGQAPQRPPVPPAPNSTNNQAQRPPVPPAQNGAAPQQQAQQNLKQQAKVAYQQMMPVSKSLNTFLNGLSGKGVNGADTGGTALYKQDAKLSGLIKQLYNAEVALSMHLYQVANGH